MSIQFPIVSPISDSLSSGLSSVDDSALDFFARAEGKGGSFDLSGVVASYTESYVKSQWDWMFKQLRAYEFIGGSNPLIKELHALGGLTFGGILAKPIYLTNDSLIDTTGNFGAGDLTAAGAAMGLVGNGVNKYLDSTLLDSALDPNDISFGCYITAATTTTFDYYIGVRDDGTSSVIRGISSSNPLTTMGYMAPSSDATISVALANDTGMHITSRRGANDVEAYRNGSSVGTDTASASSDSIGHNYYLFARNQAGTANAVADGRMSLAFFGRGLTTPQAQRLSLIFNTFMKSLGGNTY